VREVALAGGGVARLGAADVHTRNARPYAAGRQ
jgi:hypothetical protein